MTSVAVDGHVPGERHFELAWPSDLSQFSAYREKVAAFFEAHIYWQEVAEDMVLSLDEAVTNIVQHAYKGHVGQSVRMRLSLKDFQPNGLCLLTVTLLDRGSAADYDPSALLDQELSDHRMRRNAMGYGIIFLHRLMDEVRFDTSEHGENRLVLKKWFCNGPATLDYVQELAGELERLCDLPAFEPALITEVLHRYPDLEPGEQMIILGTILDQDPMHFRKAIVQARVNLLQKQTGA